jgi:hypothetical protein
LVVHLHPQFYDERKKLEYLGHIEEPMDPRAKERHEEEHEDTKKERKEQPIIISRITRLPA